MPGPHYVGLQGRTAIVQAQVFLVAIIVIIQLWLVTDALYELLSGRPGILGGLVLASFLGFVIALIIAFWPRRRIEEA
jgi:putative flippase GtrA